MDEAKKVSRRVKIWEHDKITMDWWNKQNDPSSSVILLIKDFTALHGCVDRVMAVPTNGQGLKPAFTSASTHEEQQQQVSVNLESKVADQYTPLEEGDDDSDDNYDMGDMIKML